VRNNIHHTQVKQTETSVLLSYADSGFCELNGVSYNVIISKTKQEERSEIEWRGARGLVRTSKLENIDVATGPACSLPNQPVLLVIFGISLELPQISSPMNHALAQHAVPVVQSALP